MPTSTRYSRPSTSSSPPLSSAYSVSHATSVGQQKLNVVTRLAVEGRAERGANGAAIHMYLKISIPLDSVTPGSTIPLFPEANVKILDSQVHPLDASSTPYNFSSITSPLLHKAARALNLPARSTQSYAPLSTSVATSDSLPPLDEKYTGQILVSSYHVSYILPKEFPRREIDPRSKRPSTVAQFMAAIDLWIPLLAQPPFAPFILSIPVPRCLSNHIRLKIFPLNAPKTTSSYASLSSADEDFGTWDLTSDPHVTRSPSTRLSRTNSYNNFADDESSDASTSAGFPDGCGIQGSFPSTDRIRIRWARPVRHEDIPQTVDGRRRVGIREVKGTMSCAILGAGRTGGELGDPTGVVMRVQYEAVCKGVWFPGVATLLGLDVGLDAGDCDVTWVPGKERKWTIGGDVGFTGYAVGPPPTPPLSRQSSVDNPSIYVLPSSPNGRATTNGHAPIRHDSSSSTSSLLRAPLPAQHVADYSFETSPSSTPISSLASLPVPSSPENDRRSRSSSLNGRYVHTDTESEDEDPVRAPKVPITIHLNMNDLLPPAKHDFKFRISGTVLVKPRQPVLALSSRRYRSSPNASQPSSDNEADPNVLVVPRFRVLCADRESITCTIQNDASDAAVDVYNSVGDVRSAQTRKTVLQRGGQVKCGTDGARIALRPIQQSPILPPRGRTEDDLDVSRVSRSRAQTPSRMSRRDLSPSVLQRSFFSSTVRPPIQRDGALMIPSVNITLTPLLKDNMMDPPDHAVRVNLPAPTEADMEWLEFGLSLPHFGTGPAPAREAPKIEVASASIEGVPVRFVTSPVLKPAPDGGLPFGEGSAKDYMTWVRVHLGDACGGKVEIIYLVKGEQVPTPEQPKDKCHADNSVSLNALLPSFPLPVGALEINVLMKTGFEIASVKTNMGVERSVAQGRQLLHYALEEYFHPRLLLDFVPSNQEPARATTAPPRSAWGWAQILAALVPVLLSVLLVLDRFRLASQQASQPLPESHIERLVETITVTTTVAPTSSPRWYFADTATASTVDFTSARETAQIVPSPSSEPSSSSVEISTIPTPTPTPSANISEPLYAKFFRKVIALVQDLPFETPRLEMPEFEPRETVNFAVEKALAALSLLMRLAVYPLGE
ncbi:hypothetical protein GY45DRAFT_1432280 [Cubamyces sp. BRFM 1775]|nr:hypothetical protein GY45DRAFT_1432280 [Cubamyces sp. BRFM 1775]